MPPTWTSFQHTLIAAFFHAIFTLKTDNGRLRLGAAWWVIGPILQVSVYIVVFQYFLGWRTENFVPMLLIGLFCWTWFSGGVANGGRGIVSGVSLMRRIRIAPLFFPISAVFIETAKSLFFFLVVAGALIATELLAWGRVHELALLFLVQFIFVLGTSSLIATVAPMLPDILELQNLLLRGLMFLSGVFYTYDQLEGEHKKLFLYNPVAFMIEMFRRTLLGGDAINFQGLFFIAAGGLLALCAASLIAGRCRGEYSKWLP
jgi:ABC-type polysaccharide/polyol phosphate export permease